MGTLIEDYNVNHSSKLNIYFCSINYFSKVNKPSQVES